MPKQIAIVGAGPSGLMAAEVLVAHGFSVTVYDAMPSAGRKFLQAGRDLLCAQQLTRTQYGDPRALKQS